MSALAERDGAIEGPKRALCPRCAVPILRVPLRGASDLRVLVELAEELLLWRCPTCLSGRLRDPRHRGTPSDSYFTRDQRCPRCGAWPQQAALPGDEALLYLREHRRTPPRWVGSDLAEPGVLLASDGFGRVYVPGPSIREPGEALHRRHRCAPAA